MSYDSLKAVHDNYNFRKAHLSGTTTGVKEFDDVLELLRQGKKWRVQQHHNKECGHPGVKMTNGRCVFCALAEKNSKPSPRVAPPPVTALDMLYNMLNKVDEHIAELGKQRDRIKCDIMSVESGFGAPTLFTAVKSPRQQAIAKGERWYIPYDPCKHCGIIAERYVANGTCRNCGK